MTRFASLLFKTTHALIDGLQRSPHWACEGAQMEACEHAIERFHSRASFSEFRSAIRSNVRFRQACARNWGGLFLGGIYPQFTSFRRRLCFGAAAAALTLG
jgi:hypothetical protein